MSAVDDARGRNSRPEGPNWGKMTDICRRPRRPFGRNDRWRCELARLNEACSISATRPQPSIGRLGWMSGKPHLDLELRCTCCGDRFVYSAGEQELHAVRGVAREPRQCPTCRRLLGHG